MVGNMRVGHDRGPCSLPSLAKTALHIGRGLTKSRKQWGARRAWIASSKMWVWFKQYVWLSRQQVCGFGSSLHRASAGFCRQPAACALRQPVQGSHHGGRRLP